MIQFYKNLFLWAFFTSVVDGAGGGDAGGEGEGTGEGDGGTGDGEAAKGKGDNLSKEDLDAAIKDEDWRSDLPEDLRKTADRFTSKEDAVRAIVAFQKREGQVRVPGKNATEEEIASYHKAVGVPDKAELYEFPEIEGEELTDEVKASRAEWGERFHKMNIPKDVAKSLVQMVGEDAAKMMEAEVEADKSFAKSQEDALHNEWKGEDYDKNKTLANRAFNEIAQRAGLDIEELTKIETKDGRFLMDRAEMSKLFAVIGREMSEGSLGPALSDTERDTVEDEITDVRKQISEAQSAGNTKKANRLFTKEQALIAKMNGNKNIVGANGRAA